MSKFPLVGCAREEESVVVPGGRKPQITDSGIAKFWGFVCFALLLGGRVQGRHE